MHTDADQLTTREIEVLTLISEGLSNRAIGEQLFLSLETIRWYTKRIYSKLQVRNRAQAVSLAGSLGLLTGITAPTKEAADIRLPKINLPAQVTAFIGREKELDQIATALRSGVSRLITILGAGGMGKTRLALQAAKAGISHFSDGVYFVSLENIHSEELIVPAIAEKLGVRLSSTGNYAHDLIAFMREKKLLLVLDNFETVLLGRKFVSDALQQASKLSVIVTSRERLDLRGEMICRLEGLNLPEGEEFEALLRADAVRLFMQSARQVRPNITFAPADTLNIARICRQVEGMPLGILLAAGWMDVLSTQLIAEKISDSIDFLETSIRDVPRRQRSVRAIFDHAMQMLDESNQHVFLSLSIFQGGFNYQAAEALAGAQPKQLTVFSGKSLIHFDPVSGRYRMHNLLQQYAYERLAEMHRLDSVQLKHMDYFADVLKKLETDLKSGAQVAALDQIHSDFHNLRAAWFSALRYDRPEQIIGMLDGIYWFCSMRDRVSEGHELFQAAREHFGKYRNLAGTAGLRKLLLRFDASGEDYRNQLEEALRHSRKEGTDLDTAFLLWAHGVNGYVMRRFREAHNSLSESLGLFKKFGDDFYAVEALHLLWMCSWFLGNGSAAKKFYTEARDLAGISGNKIAVARALGAWGAFQLVTGAYQEAEQSTQEALELRSELQDRSGVAMSQAYLGWLAAIRGDLEEARALIDSSLRLAEDTHNLNSRLTALNILGWIEAIEGNAEKARQHCAMSLTLSPDPTVRAGADLGLAFAYCGLQDHVRAQVHLRKILEFSRQFKGDGMMRISLAVAVLLSARKAEQGFATELLSFILNAADEKSGWMYRWNPLIDLKGSLRSDMGDEAFMSSWGRGKTRDLNSLVAEFLEKDLDSEG